MKDLFIALLNMSISATWLIAAVVLVRLCMGKAPKWIRGVLWAMVALRLVVPFALESPISLVPDVQISADASITDEAEDAPSTEQVYTPPVTDAPVINTPVVTPDVPSVSEPTIDTPIIGAPIVDGPVIDEPVFTPDEAPEEEPVTVADEKKGVDIRSICAIIWAVGVLAMAAYCVGSYWRLKIILMGAVRVGDGVYESEWIKSAFVLGILRPIIYIPRALPASEREYVIAHERVHISRFDYILKPLGFLILALHWFNPSVWLAYILYCRDIELACDEKVIKGYSVEQIKGYSRALVSCGEGHSRMLVCPIAFGEVGIKERVKNILNYKKPTFWIIIGAVVLCVIVAICFMTVRGGEESSSTESTEQTVGTEASDGSEGTENTEPTDDTDPTEPGSSNPTDEPTDDPDEPSDSTDSGVTPLEPVDPIDLKIVGTKSRPAGAKELDTDPAPIFSTYGDTSEYFEMVTIRVANSVDSTHSYMINVFDSYDEFAGLIDAINEGESYDKVELSDYDEEFFRENILIISYNRKLDRVSVGGGELCLEFDHKMSIHSYGLYYDQLTILVKHGYYGAAIRREDLDGVDTLSICSKHIYDNLPEQIPALPQEYTLESIKSPVSGEKGEYNIVVGNEFPKWDFNCENTDDYLSVKYEDKSRNIRTIVYEDEFWLKWHLSSGNHTYDKNLKLPEVFSKYDSEFFKEKALVMLQVPGAGEAEHTVAFNGKKDGKLYFSIRLWKGVFKNWASSWTFLEIDKELLNGVNGIALYVKLVDYKNSPVVGFDLEPADDEKDHCESYGHTWLSATCTTPATCKVCGKTDGEALGHGAMSFATCTHNGKCLACGAVTEAALGHNFVNNICIRGCCDRVRKNTDPSVKYVYHDSREDLVIDVLDGAISFDGSFEITNGLVKVNCKVKNCDELIQWNMSQVKSYVNGKLSDWRNVTAGTPKAGGEWDEMTFYIPYTEDGEYLINLYYGDPTMPYTVTVSFPVLTKIQMM